MADLYSVSIMQVQGLTAPQTIEVPDGKVLVVRDIWSYWNSATEAFSKLYVTGDFAQTFWFVLYDQLDTQPIAFWQGRIVLHTQLVAYTDGGAIDVSISGYLLSLP
jgi:hypothetical protein